MTKCLLDTALMWIEIFCLIFWQKKFFRKEVKWNSILKEIFFTGVLAVWENHGNSRGWGYDKHPLEWKFQEGEGSKTEVPSVGVGVVGGIVYFLELRN